MDGNIGRRPGQLAAAVRSLIQSTHQPKPTNSPLHELTQTLRRSRNWPEEARSGGMQKKRHTLTHTHNLERTNMRLLDI